MADYKTMYRVLFAATEDVLALLEKYMASAEESCSPDADTGNTGERAAKMRRYLHGDIKKTPYGVFLRAKQRQFNRTAHRRISE